MDARIDFPWPDGQPLRAVFSSPRQSLRADRLEQVPAVLAAAERAALAGHWVVGWVAYEAAPAFDPALRVKASAGSPLALFAVYDVGAAGGNDTVPCCDGSAVSGDSQGSKVALPGFFCRHWHSSMSESAAASRIAQIHRGIRDGDYYQLNLTQRTRSEFSGAAETFFQALTDSQPGAYAAYLDWGEGQILSVSPELFFQRTGPMLTTRPMKGTAPRHLDPADDFAAAEQLRASVKERAENLMIVDLLRNDLSRIAETGSVRVDRLFEVEPWASVWQMTSTISAQARPGVGLTDLFVALFPCGSVTGAPKVAAMAGIAELEDSPRGVYCGAIGVLKPGGDAVFSVGIRSVAIADGVATCGLGSAITIDSTADGEYAEWMAKRRFLLRASARFELIETLRLDLGADEANRYVRLDRHLQRLMGSAAWFGFTVDEAAIRGELTRIAAACRRSEGIADPFGSDGKSGSAATAALASGDPAPGVFRVRLLLARDGRVRAEAFPLEVTPAEVRVRLADRPIVGEPEFLRHKTTERRAYEAFSDLPTGVFDTLLFNERDELTELTRGNVFLEEAGVLLTPPESAGLLPGVLRAELLAGGRAREAVLRREQLTAASRLWFGNSVRGLIPARLV